VFSAATRDKLRSFLWIVLLLVASAEALVVFGYVYVLVSQGPRGIVGHFEHLALSGLPWPKSEEEFERIFWRSTGPILAVQLGGLVVIYGSWKLLKQLGPQGESQCKGEPSVTDHGTPAP
jgi:hypothetical protein